ncbi:MAG: endopeptidase La, partial [Clostridia bacterium]|nr:endopeptidase La [Clostridia bacterium]
AVESTVTSGKGALLLTGKLGDVMKESAQTAYTFIKTNKESLGLSEIDFSTFDVHVHVPEGATPKDGPSAGITIATAIYSAFSKKKVKNTVAMTGEITLRGNVLPIGGLKQKALSAFRCGIYDIIIPEKNLKDIVDIDEKIRKSLNFIPVKTCFEVFKNAII